MKNLIKLITILSFLTSGLAIAADCSDINDGPRRQLKKRCTDGSVVDVNQACGDGSDGVEFESEGR